MDAATYDYAKTLHIHHFKPDEVPWRRLGQYLYRVVEDGSNTQYRLAAIESLLPPRSKGPVFHFHEMHDEGFFVIKGTVRFHSPGRPDIDAKAGDMVTVPIRLPHRFSNPFNEEAVFVNTITPGFFVRYFEYLEELIGEGTELTEEVNRAALLRFATVPLGRAALTMLDEPDAPKEMSRKENGKGVEEDVPKDAKDPSNGDADAGLKTPKDVTNESAGSKDESKDVPKDVPKDGAAAPNDDAAESANRNAAASKDAPKDAPHDDGNGHAGGRADADADATATAQAETPQPVGDRN